MSTLVESLKRLYHVEVPKITIEKLDNMLMEKKITQDEYNYIVV